MNKNSEKEEADVGKKDAIFSKSVVKMGKKAKERKKPKLSFDICRVERGKWKLGRPKHRVHNLTEKIALMWIVWIEFQSPVKFYRVK